MQFRLRTLLIVLAVAPPLLAIGWWLWPLINQRTVLMFGPWELLLVGVVAFILFGQRIPSLMRNLFRAFYL